MIHSILFISMATVAEYLLSVSVDPSIMRVLTTQSDETSLVAFVKTLLRIALVF